LSEFPDEKPGIIEGFFNPSVMHVSLDFSEQCFQHVCFVCEFFSLPGVFGHYHVCSNAFIGFN